MYAPNFTLLFLNPDVHFVRKTQPFKPDIFLWKQPQNLKCCSFFKALNLLRKKLIPKFFQSNFNQLEPLEILQPSCNLRNCQRLIATHAETFRYDIQHASGIVKVLQKHIATCTESTKSCRDSVKIRKPN